MRLWKISVDLSKIFKIDLEELNLSFSIEDTASFATQNYTKDEFLGGTGFDPRTTIRMLLELKGKLIRLQV